MPLVARGQCLGCLYITGRSETLRLDASDLIFLKALAGQLAAALDRAELAARERQLKERESRRLRAELDELRQAGRETRMVHCSPQIEALLETVRRVAPSDATVLVSGETGTGKELVARMVHALSPRRGRPPVVVDCGAISASLIESELFGHERGAYTGAAGRTVGRLAEAAGSTLILDEIGEFPLEVQAKLLRFVQEKEIVPVGGARPKKVDARLVAVTNRDLGTEVAGGRFREDLYYRLKVVHLRVPSLAERPDDVPLLMEHFVERFSARYGNELRLSAEAMALAARHPWPGNVRELENRVLQAVLLCESGELGPEDLGLGDAAVLPASPPTAGLRDAPATAQGAAAQPRAEAAEAWKALRRELRRQIERAMAEPADRPPPLGRWLAQDLELAARDVAHGMVRRAAALLGMPESTLGRRLRRAEARRERRPSEWEAVPPLLAELLRAAHPPGSDLPDLARQLLLEEVARWRPRNAATGAALMGISERTYRSWRRALAR